MTADDSVFFFIKLVLGCLILVAVVYWLFGTELGSSIRATGCNSQMARAQGINTNFTKVIALMISNGLVGLCGGIYAQYQGSADVECRPWRHCYRSCCRDYQRGYFCEAVCR